MVVKGRKKVLVEVEVYEDISEETLKAIIRALEGKGKFYTVEELEKNLEKGD